MTRSNSRQEDERRSEQKPDKVTAKHGGKVVETIAPEDILPVHDSECKHENLVRDPSETEFNAFMCANPDCAVVVLFDKTK